MDCSKTSRFVRGAGGRQPPTFMRRLPLIERGLAATKLSRAQLDQALVAQMELRKQYPNCKAGCSHCCHYPLTISVFEGALLYSELKTRRLWTTDLELALTQHSKKVLGLAPEVWLMSEVPCPLLREGTCTAYSARPFVCRSRWALGDPEDCRPARFGLSATTVDHGEQLEVFRAQEKAVAKSVRAPYATYPISTAVLLGHAVVEDGLDISDVWITAASLYGANL